MKKKYIRLLSAVMSIVLGCGLLSPALVSASSSDAYFNGLQKFFDEGNHAQLVNCPDAVYMEYAEQLRTNPVGSISMTVLGLIYGGFGFKEKVEPNKDRYKEVLLNIIRIYEEENAEIIAQQNLINDTKEFKDYLHDVVDTEMDWLEVIGASDAMGPAASMALSVINEMMKDEDDLVKGISTLKTTLQNYEKYDAFLQLVVANSEGELQLAASELRVGLSEVMKVRLLSYADLVKDSADDYAKLFASELFAEGFRDALEETFTLHIGKIHIGETSYLKAFQAAKLGVDIGKIAGNILIGAEDVMSYVVEVKAVHDISIILENELESIKNFFQKDNSKATETDAQNYITYGNFLISSRVRGQYCMTAIYLQPPMQKWLKDSDVENAKALYNRLTNNLLSIKKKLDAIVDGDMSVTSPVVDAVNYEKDVVIHPSLEGVWEPQGIKHQIRIPKIALDTTSAQKFNQKIYNNHCAGYEQLLSNQEANQIFDCSYEYKVYNGVVAIAVLDGGAVQAGGGWLSYKVYYYSLDEDSELTFDGYLDAVGLTYDTAVSRIMQTNDYKEATQHAWEPVTNMTDCLLDEKGTFAFFENIATMDGWSQIITSSILNSENDNATFTLMLNGIEADSIQYYNCSESGNFAVIQKNGKYGIIGYDGEILLPIEYDEIYQGRGHSYDYLWASKGDYFYSINVNCRAEESWGYPGGDVDPDAYWYNGQLVVFMPAEGVIGGLEELSWVAVEQRSWQKDAVLPVQEMSGIKQESWGPMPKVDNSNYALLDTSTGKLVSDFVYSGFDTGNGFCEGVLAVKKGDKWGYIDTDGNEITEFIYDPYEQDDVYEDMEYKYSIFTAVNGYIAVLKDGKWGLIDTQGNTVVEPVYDGISQVNSDGMFWLEENGSWSLYKINK